MLASVVGWLEQSLGATRLHLWLIQLAIAFAMLAVGIWISRWMARGLDRLLQKFGIEEILRSFLRNVAYGILLVVVFIAALDFIGVPTTSLLAVVGAAGLAIGLALRDSLSNIASGVMLIVLRPFHIGDQVQVAGQEGVVQSVHIFQTRLLTADNRQIILPNSLITTAPIINYTGLGSRRVEVTVPVGYDEDLGALRVDIAALLGAMPLVQKAPSPEVTVGAFGEKTVTVQLQAWVPARDYPAARAKLLEAVLDIFQRRGLRSPMPAREVHLHHVGAPALSVPEDALKAATGRDA